MKIIARVKEIAAVAGPAEGSTVTVRWHPEDGSAAAADQAVLVSDCSSELVFNRALAEGLANAIRDDFEVRDPHMDIIWPGGHGA